MLAAVTRFFLGGNKAAPLLRNVKWSEGVVDWSSCPVCRSVGDKRRVLEMRLGSAAKRALATRRIQLLQCPACEVRYCQPLRTVDYHGANRDGLKFYLEQGAGINSMLAPLSMADGRTIARYIEIGCAFGFSMDYARRVLGWDVKGYDPGAIAAVGRELLSLPIENQLFDGLGATEEKADLVFCSEVIEHIAAPHAFIRLVRDALSPQGLLLMTTPNGDALEPQLPAEMMLPILSPGHHVVLYNARSLETLLRQAGFDHVRIDEDRNQLRVAASLSPFSGTSAYFSPELFRRYLRAAVDAAPKDNALFAGLIGRLLKEDTNAARYADAREHYVALRDAYRAQYGIDTDAPGALILPGEGELTFNEFGRRYPSNLTSVWYCRGIIQLVAEGEPAMAARSFLAAIRFGDALRAHLRPLGADDLETAQLCREAEIARLSALAQHDPAEALAAFESLASRTVTDDAARTAHIERARSRLFGDLINLGHQHLAEQIATDDPALLTRLLESGNLAGLFAWGLYILNVKSDFVLAREIFARAWEHARRQGANGEDLWFARFHQALASRYAGESEEARSIASELLNPPAGLPPVTEQITRRVHELIAAE